MISTASFSLSICPVIVHFILPVPWPHASFLPVPWPDIIFTFYLSRDHASFSPFTCRVTMHPFHLSPVPWPCILFTFHLSRDHASFSPFIYPWPCILFTIHLSRNHASFSPFIYPWPCILFTIHLSRDHASFQHTSISPFTCPVTMSHPRRICLLRLTSFAFTAQTPKIHGLKSAHTMACNGNMFRACPCDEPAFNIVHYMQILSHAKSWKISNFTPFYTAS